MTWDGEWDATLRDFWAAGFTGDRIAGLFTTLGFTNTRSGILARARRLQLPSRPRGRRRGENYGLKADRSDPTNQRRFVAFKASGRSAMNLRADHPAILEGRTLFPTRVFEPDHPKVLRLLKSGENSSKTGKRVTKGRMRGFPIYTLTLEERATCPRTCLTWRTCYGSNMQFAQRIRHGLKFEQMLRAELEVLNVRHPRGFLVRLHVLGDFYSVGYVRLWREAIEDLDALHVWGYTARLPHTLIGRSIEKLATERWDRFAVRFSGANMPTMASHVVTKVEDATSTVCPMQIHEKPACCADCALCWQSKANITFLMH